KHSIINQALIEKSVAGWKEIEFEVIRDGADNCIIVCSMENIDPAGIHTGDSIVIAPVQTLGTPEYLMLRDASYKIIRALGVEGGCNIQFALDPKSLDYAVIEVNPRVSRSSALASKATGYPIARVAGKIAIGLRLDQITNAITGLKNACFEPVMDYCVVKIPRWPFDKFALAQRNLGTQMKATGEVMAIERSVEAALMKAVRSLEIGVSGLSLPGTENKSETDIRRRLAEPDDERLFIIAEALRREMSTEEIGRLTGIDLFFINKINNIIEIEKKINHIGEEGKILPVQLWKQAREAGFTDMFLHELMGDCGEKAKEHDRRGDISPVYKKVDACAGGVETMPRYLYSSYGDDDESAPTPVRKMIVLGSGPIRIGQGIEFDYCSVHASWALRDEGIETIIVNSNPETVSTDFDTSDRLYFEPVTVEDVMNIVEREGPEGVIVQFGGQTAINIADSLHRKGVRIIGTSVESIDRTEDREKFDLILEELDLKRPPGKACYSLEQALKTASAVGFPVVVRPSYVLGGRAMEIVYRDEELKDYMETAVKVSPHHPVLVDKYLDGLEIEVDAVCDGEDILIPGIMEHIERAGVHSGDSIAVYPPQRLSENIYEELLSSTRRLGRALDVRGMINAQYVVYGGELYLLEVNPRSSRTVPFMSKVTGIPLIKLAVKVSLGQTLQGLGYCSGIVDPPSYVSVKAPVFSFGKIMDLDTVLGPEMKSTGEVIGMGPTFASALYKALVAAGFSLPAGGRIQGSQTI
ncbi:MAG: carbamoyl-phosphate synthase large subunit, partial [Firmicutes bacterium]|nr:carbamoyl-phosphate synthase large subunit [Bacillota bacterium]